MKHKCLRPLSSFNSPNPMSALKVYAAVRKYSKDFLLYLKKEGKEYAEDYGRLRPHTGRATLITELMGEGVSTAVSMKYASLNFP